MTGQLKVEVYQRDYATLEEIITNKVQDLRFSTKLPGGFYICSFRMRTDLMQSWDWLQNKIFYHLKITDGSKTVWEGRIEDIELSSGAINVTAYGYYSNLSDQVYYTAYNDVWSTVLGTALTDNCPQISATTHFTATDRVADSAAGDEWLDLTPMQMVEKFLPLSDSTNAIWDFGVWESREAWLSKRSPTALNWLTRLGDFNSFRLRYSAKSLFNKVYTIYQAGGATTRTAEASDTTSQTKYTVTRKHGINYTNLGQDGIIAAQEAQTVRDADLARNKDLWPTFASPPVLGAKVTDLNGVTYPSSWIRAGEVIRVRDLVPASGVLDSVTLNAKQTFMVVETEYDMDRRQMSLTFDRNQKSLVALLAKIK